MPEQLIFQFLIAICGVYFTFIGMKTLFSKQYYVEQIESCGGKRSLDDAYREIPSWRIVFTRYGLGGQWLVLGLGFLALFFFSVFR